MKSNSKYKKNVLLPSILALKNQGIPKTCGNCWKWNSSVDNYYLIKFILIDHLFYGEFTCQACISSGIQFIVYWLDQSLFYQSYNLSITHYRTCTLWSIDFIKQTFYEGLALPSIQYTNHSFHQVFTKISSCKHFYNLLSW